MKKSSVLAVTLLLLLTLSSCGGEESAGKGMTVTSTSPSVGDIMQNAGQQEAAADTGEGAPGKTAAVSPAENAAEVEVDIDLTTLSSTMVYSEVYDIMMDPEAYVGKVIRMRGQALSSYYEPTDQTYYSIIIADATACCAQGIEYVLTDGYTYPADDDTATITGTFESYEEEGAVWYHLTDAVVEA